MHPNTHPPTLTVSLSPGLYALTLHRDAERWTPRKGHGTPQRPKVTDTFPTASDALSCLRTARIPATPRARRRVPGVYPVPVGVVIDLATLVRSLRAGHGHGED